MAWPQRGVGVSKGLATTKKTYLKLYLSYFKNLKKVPFATKLEGRGYKALVAGPLRKNNFFDA